MPELFRVRALRYIGRTPNGGPSDKVWAGVMLKRSGGWAYASVWGSTGKAMNTAVHPWTSANTASKQFDKKVNEKLAEGYKEIDWNEWSYGMASTIVALGEGAPARTVPEAVANGDVARKAWRTRKATTADKAANDALASVDLDVPPRPAPAPSPPSVPGMRSIRRDMRLD